MKTYTVKEVAQMLQVDGQTIRRWIKDGKMVAFKVPSGRAWRIEEEEVERIRKGEER